jgi:hypothetical protein
VDVPACLARRVFSLLRVHPEVIFKARLTKAIRLSKVKQHQPPTQASKQKESRKPEVKKPRNLRVFSCRL